MSDTVVRLEHVTKEYRLGTIGQGMLYRDIQSWWAGVRGKEDPNSKISLSGISTMKDSFLALDDVSFDVKRGDVVGIIGRNGAGKSTLLKIISRVTAPTKGAVKLKGRVASLLEVGTGFHPELTGRENIYLNGAILGMRRNEINRKFDTIVDFAEVEEFIDTPVKRYSSGMYVRLAFAVAAHLEPEILIVDEVLSVGDLQFQKKCLGKMGEISRRGGRTVLYVSHNLQSVSDLCSKAFLLDKGAVVSSGETEKVVNAYVSMGNDMRMARRDLSDPGIRSLDVSNPQSVFKWTDISIVNSEGECVNEILFGEPFEIVFRGYSSEDCAHSTIGLALSNRKVGYIFGTHQIYNNLPDGISKGVTEYRVRIEQNILKPDYYSVEIGAVGTLKVADYLKEALSFSISDVPFNPEKQWRTSVQPGFVYYPCQWNCRLVSDADVEICSRQHI
jgi:lipopolysaccharide transport system ATP-binding protein